MNKLPLIEYEICAYTMAVLPEETENGLYSRVMEMESSYLVKMKPLDIIERSCRFFGSSMKGRREGTKEIMGITHKAPIVIDPTNYIYFFPTLSPNRPQCAWISHSFVQKIQSSEFDETLLIFSNRTSIQLPVSKGSIENQLFRTAQLITTLSNRISSDNRKTSFLSPAHIHQREER